jgi:pimeloyl-ACP methyl ester carboxylesterase
LKAKVNGIEMYYEDSGKGTPLVLIHGIGGDSTEWSEVTPQMSKEVRCIAVDLRGHGKSEKPDMPYTQDMFADDVAALLDNLKIGKAYICGISMGGFVAEKMALNHPEKVDGLILIDTTSRMPAKTIQVGGAWAKAFAERGLQGYIDAEIKDIFHPIFARRHKDAIKRFADSMKTRDFKTSTRVQQGYMKSPPVLDKDIKKINVPTLIIHGREDEVVPFEEAELIHKEIQNSQIAILPFAGHGALMERPDYFIDLITYFIDESKKKTKSQTTGS